MKSLFILFFLVVGFLCSSPGFAQEYVDEQRSATSNQKSRVSARQEIIEKVIQSVSMEYVTHFVGADKAQRNATVIQNKVVRNSGKYISYIKANNLTKEEDHYRMDVSLKISPKDLKQILLSKGLLYQLDGPPKILLMVNLVDKVSLQSFSWWASDEPGFLRDQSKKVNSIFQNKLKDKGFYSFSPIKRKFYYTLPEAYRADELLEKETLFVGDFFKAQVVVRGRLMVSGSVELDQYDIQFSAEALQALNGRNIAKVTRRFSTERGEFNDVVSKALNENFPKVAEDLTVQLHEAWQKGVFGSDLLEITLVGKFNYQQYQKLKKTLQGVRLIKALRERSFSPDEIIFELDANTSIKQIGQALNRSKVEGVKFSVSAYGQKSVRVKAKVL